jgi:hypothetical protein
MRDVDVRAALHSQLSESIGPHGDDTLVVDELGLCGTARVDVAVVNGSLSGFELKSDVDTLRRLPAQVETYGTVLDHVTLVVTERHLEPASALVPDWWGVLVAKVENGQVALTATRPPGANPAVDPAALAQLLWRDEALSVLTHRGLDAGVRSKPRWALWERLAQSLELDELRDEVRAALKRRRGWRAAQ